MKYSSVLSVVLACGLIISGCSAKQNDSAATGGSAEKDAEMAAIPVKVLTLSKSKISRTIDYTSTVLPFEEVNVAPSTPGRVEKIYVEEGDPINRGDKLFLMDRTQLYQLQLQLASLEKDLARLDTLLTTGSVRQQQYDQMKTQYDVTKTNVDFMAENTLLKSPFTGIVTGRYFENGEMYTGAPTTRSGKPAVVTIMQINPLKINVSISEQYYPLIRKGMKANISADVYANEVFTGTVFRVAPTVDALTRSFIAEIELANKNGMLKPGMFARVSMDLEEVETFVVPANTVMIQEGTNIRYVFTAENDEAVRHVVGIGKRFDDRLEIISDDIKAGDRLITEGQARLISGNKIQIAE